MLGYCRGPVVCASGICDGVSGVLILVRRWMGAGTRMGELERTQREPVRRLGGC